MTPPPPPPNWFGPRASTDDPAVAALLDQVAPARTWQDIGGSFNLNVRLDAAAPLVLRVHRPWATRGRVAGLRRLRERLQRAGIRVAQPVPILGRDLAKVGGRWAELEEFVPHVQPNPSQESYLRLFEDSAACTRGCARPGSRTCPSRSTTTEPTASCTTGSASRVAVWALGPSPWCAAPSSSSTSWAKPGAASTSRALRSTATTSSATRSSCRWLLGESRSGFRAHPGAALRRSRQPVLGI